MLQGEHSAILLTFIKLPFVTKIFVLSSFEWPFYTGFTVLLLCLQMFGSVASILDLTSASTGLLDCSKVSLFTEVKPKILMKFGHSECYRVNEDDCWHFNIYEQDKFRAQLN